MDYIVGNKYTRTIIRNMAGDPGTNGKWVKGYCEHNGEFYIFCNIKGKSYTGVDHNNFWLNDHQLSWNAMKKSRKDSPFLSKMLKENQVVHIFTREGSSNNKDIKGEPFIYSGLGNPEKIEGSDPVHVVWNVNCERDNTNNLISENLEDTNYLDGIEESLNRYIPESIIISDTPEVYNSNGYTQKSITVKRSNKVAVNALVNANFECEIDINHRSFTSKKYYKQYVEAHHIIPISLQDKYKNKLDKEANIISLCPNCHRTLHHGIKEERETLLDIIYNLRSERLDKIGIKLDKESLFKMYNK